MPAPIIPAPSTPTLVARERLDALGAQLAGVDRLQVEEERLDHVLGVLADDQPGQVARLDPARGVEVDLRALDRGRQDRPLARGRPRPWSACAAAPGTPAGTPRAWATAGCRRASCSPGGPTGSYGGLGVVAVLEDPGLGGRDQVVAGRRRARRRGPSPGASAGLKRVPWSSTSISADWRPSIRTTRVTPPPPGSRPRVASGRPSSAAGRRRRSGGGRPARSRGRRRARRR